MIKIQDFYSNNFNLLRVFAAFLVLISHCFELIGKLNEEPLYIYSNGLLRFSSIGLYLFYFASGFLVAQSFYTSKSIFSFVKKRVLRIYPALIVLTVITVFIIGPLFSTLSISNYFKNPETFSYLFNITGFHLKYFLPGIFTNSAHFDKGVNGSLWSIALELKLYLLLIVFSAMNRRRLILGNTAVLGFSLLLGFLVTGHFFDLDKYFDELHCRLVIIFFMGYVANAYYRQIKLSWIFSILLMAAYVFLLRYFISLRFVIEPLFFAYLTLVFSYKIKLLKPKMDVSYGMYLYSFLITQIVIELFQINQPLVLVAIVIVAVLPISVISWLLIEKKALALKNSS